jgi:hypothetical protein
MYENQLLDCIDVIQEQSTLAELNVLTSLVNSYTKSVMILESADDSTDLSSFDIFQEGKVWNDLNAALKGQYGESKIKKIRMFIPRLIMKFMRIIVKSLSTLLNLMGGVYNPEILKSERYRESLPVNYEKLDDFAKTLFLNLSFMELSGQPTPEQFLAYFPTMKDRSESLIKALDKYRENNDGFKEIFTTKTYTGFSPVEVGNAIQQGKTNLKNCIKIAENVVYQSEEIKKAVNELSEQRVLDQDVIDNINTDAMAVSSNLAQITQIITKISETYMSVYKHGEADVDRVPIKTVPIKKVGDT